MQNTNTDENPLITNLFWFLGSIALAFLVWLFANLQTDPISESVFTGVNVDIIHDESLIITQQSRETVSVIVRAPGTVLQQIDQRDVNNDIEVIADLSGFGAGTHRVDLQPNVSRQRTAADTSPRQIVVSLEEFREQFKPIEWVINSNPPQGFELRSEPTLSTSQVLVSGPASQVQAVESARAILNLATYREGFASNYRLVPVKADGSIVENVTLEPATIDISVDIQLRSGFREVRIIPDVLDETLTEGYALTSLDNNPKMILISGPEAQLMNLPGTLRTAPIDLTDRISSFEQVTTVEIPNEEIFIVSGQNITVSVGISPLLSSTQFDRIPIDLIGETDDYLITFAPEEVTVLLTGPQLVLNGLAARDIHVTLDITNLGAGNYQLSPTVTINQGQTIVSNVSVLPATIDIGITARPPTEQPDS